MSGQDQKENGRSSREVLKILFSQFAECVGIAPHLERFVNAHCHRFKQYDPAAAELTHGQYHIFRLFCAEFDRHIGDFLERNQLSAEEVSRAIDELRDDFHARTFLSFVATSQDVRAFASLMRSSYDWNRRKAAAKEGGGEAKKKKAH